MSTETQNYQEQIIYFNDLQWRRYYADQIEELYGSGGRFDRKQAIEPESAGDRDDDAIKGVG